MDIVDRVSMWEEHKKIGLCPEREFVLGGFSLGRVLTMQHHFCKRHMRRADELQ